MTATEFDGLDRPVTKYKMVDTSSTTAEDGTSWSPSGEQSPEATPTKGPVVVTPDSLVLALGGGDQWVHVSQSHYDGTFSKHDVDCHRGSGIANVMDSTDNAGGSANYQVKPVGAARARRPSMAATARAATFRFQL